ncbi:hypothetical protein VARIO8X_130087 [Burkholderiales bacterium 8X]|nr:hypothetical protein VARIO8X_130087 [Burkholderiales bacterium 8X]
MKGGCVFGANRVCSYHPRAPAAAHPEATTTKRLRPCHPLESESPALI